MSLQGSKLVATIEEQFDALDQGQEISPTPTPTPDSPQAPEPPSEPEPKEAPPAPPVAPPQESKAAQPQATQAASPEPATSPTPTDLLAGLSRNERDALLKFAKGGRISTPEELAAAREAFHDDYWRTQRRMAELAKEKEEAPKAPPAPPPTPSELLLYDNKLKEVQNKAAYAVNQHGGWQNEKKSVNTQINNLRRKRSSGDATVDDELLRLTEYRDEIDQHLQYWETAFQNLQSEQASLAERRQEMAHLLETRQGLATLQQQIQEERDNAYQASFEQRVISTLKQVAQRHQVPEGKLSKLEKTIRNAVFVRAHNEGPFDDENPHELESFLDEVTKEFMEPILEARKEAELSYAATKAADAPKPPPQAKDPKKLVDQKPNGESQQFRSFEDLKNSLLGSPAWDA